MPLGTCAPAQPQSGGGGGGGGGRAGGRGAGWGMGHDAAGDGGGAFLVGGLQVGVVVEDEADAAVEVDAALTEFVFRKLDFEPYGGVGLG